MKPRADPRGSHGRRKLILKLGDREHHDNASPANKHVLKKTKADEEIERVE